MTLTESKRPPAGNISTTKAWLGALERTASIAKNPSRIFASVVEDIAEEAGGAPALLADRESLTYGELAKRTNQYARWALSQGIRRGDTVCLLMANRPEYLAIWLGITKIGGLVALLNTNLTGAALAHCIRVTDARHLIIAGEHTGTLNTVLPHLPEPLNIWVQQGSDHSFRSIDEVLKDCSGERLSDLRFPQTTIDDPALLIYTSGTTGLPKAAHVSHGRIMQWSHWFAGMMNTKPADRMYNCLPMYHSVGGVVATGAMLAAGGSLVLCERFSARRFWSDVNRWECTLFQYIGELCRYLLHAPSMPESNHHQLRMACGNGLRGDIWDDFKTRFRIPHIFEFYAATEGGVSLFNIEGEPGAIGRVPPYLAHRFSPGLVRFDVEKGAPLRNEQGFCSLCSANEVGEAISPLANSTSNLGARFEGYTNQEASEKKILRDVFKPGDAWFRTGDLMRRDERGFYYFVDRIGDTFRWKGENVSTFEVSEAICEFPGVREANVYGVCIPESDGRAGMAAVVSENSLDLSLFRAHLDRRLPSYARPLFLRLRSQIEVTGTFKYTKSDFVRQGYDPAGIPDPLYFNHPELKEFVPLDVSLYQSIQSGQIRI